MGEDGAYETKEGGKKGDECLEKQSKNYLIKVCKKKKKAEMWNQFFCVNEDSCWITWENVMYFQNQTAVRRRKQEDKTASV